MARCPHCRQTYERKRMGQKSCEAVECAIAAGQARKAKEAAKKAKADRAEIRVRKEKAKTLGQLAKEAQYYVNRYARLRDRNKPCVSCDRPASWQGQWHASHLKSVGANSALRFNLWNIHKACSICNNHLSGNIGEYKARLPERIGRVRFEFLETHARQRTYSREYLIRLKSVFAKRCRILERRIDHAVQD